MNLNQIFRQLYEQYGENELKQYLEGVTEKEGVGLEAKGNGKVVQTMLKTYLLGFVTI